MAHLYLRELTLRGLSLSFCVRVVLSVNAGENWQCLGDWFILLDKVSLVGGFLVKCLQHENLWRVVVPVQLLDVAMLVTVDATDAIHARLGEVEGPAVLALELVRLDTDGSLCELLLSVGEPAFVLISALADFNPVLAHLGLELTIVIDIGIASRVR